MAWRRAILRELGLATRRIEATSVCRTHSPEIPLCHEGLGAPTGAAYWPFRLLAVLAAMASLTNVAFAQADFEKGYQSYQSYHGSDFDTVNLANGNLVLNIPLISYPQRGGLPPVVVAIRSNSTTFQSVPPYVSGPADVTQHEVASGVIGAPQGQPHVSISPGGLSWREQRTGPASDYRTRYVAIDESGATHSLAGGIANATAGYIANIQYSVDGSGLMLQPGTTATGPVLVDRNGNVGGLIDPNGNAIQLKGSCATAAGSGDYYNASLPSWEGYAHGTAAAQSIVDSVGRVIPNPTYLPPVANYSCLVDMDATYHPANTTSASCETWNFPAQNAPGGTGATVPLVFCYAPITVNAQIPSPSGSNLQYPLVNETWWVLTSATLPNKTSWTFTYDNYGQVSSVTMPTGAVVSYQYQTRIACGNPPGENPVSGTPTWPFSNLLSSRMVSVRTLTVPNGPTQSWTYVNQIGSGWESAPAATDQSYAVVTPGGPNQGTVTVTDLASNMTTHTFTLQGGSTCGPYESATQYYEGSGSTAVELKEVQTSFSNTGTDYANPTNFSNYIALGVFPQTVTTTLFGGAGPVASQETYAYDTFGTYQDYIEEVHPFSFGLVQSSSEYDWIAATPSAQPPQKALSNPLRTTTHKKLWQSSFKYYEANLIDLPYQDTVLCEYSSSSSICPSVGSQLSQTTYAYDETAYSSSSAIGNLTSVTHWLASATSSPTTHSFYTAASSGMPTQKQDANGNITQLSYDSSGLFLNRITYPDSTFEIFAHDDNTGLLISNTDVNHQKTSYTYDNMRRLTHVAYPDGGSEGYCFFDLSTSPACNGPNGTPVALTVPSFIFSKAINSNASFFEAGLADGLGRLIHKQLLSNPYGTVHTDTTYDLLGRVQSVSNPYYTASDATYGFTSYRYDALNRKTTQCQPDNGTTTVCSIPASSSQSWNYGANTTTFTDEAGNQWARTADAFGNLIQVAEPNGTSTAATLPTQYTYDGLGNLTKVVQAGNAGTETPRTRSFTYDSLSRLITSTNPETGTTCYGRGDGTVAGCQSNGYDLNGNLLYKTDATGMTISYSYDVLNRLKTKSAPDNGMTNYTYTYDQGVNGIGRLTQETSTNLVGTEFTYDTMGRVASAAPYYYPAIYNGWGPGMSVLYDLAGNPTQLTYPDGRVVTQGFDGAGQLETVADATPNGTPVSYFTGGANGNPAYTAAGALQNLTLGNSVTQTNQYNSRLEPCRWMASTLMLPANPNGGNLLDREYFYSTGSPTNCGPEAKNNGNIWSIVDNLQPGNTQSFNYDSLNRLTSGLQSGGSYNQSYKYDSFGNMVLVDNLHTPLNYGIDAATNRLTLNGTDLGYYPNGDLSSSPGHTFVYTAEEYLRSIDNYNTGSYLYNGEGERTLAGHPASWNEYVYLNGQPMADVDNTGKWTDYIYANGQKIAKVDSGSTNYYLYDHLGTTQMELSSTGSLSWQGEFTPFGQEIIGGTTQNLIGPLPPDGTDMRYKFTGKERDAESGLDYFGARYYASSMGRWMSPDPMKVSPKHLMYPQRWNAYAYVQNNPLNAIDPDGWDDFKIFVNFNPGQLGNKETSLHQNWGKIAAQARANGHTVEFVEASSRNYTEALQSGSHVIDAGHTFVGTNPTSGVFLREDGMFVGNTGQMNNVSLPANINAKSVDIFGCDSVGLASQYSQAGTFVGVNSGQDRDSNNITMVQAAQAFLQSATSSSAQNPVNLDAAAKAAQGVISNSSNLSPTGPDGTLKNVDIGDRVVVDHNHN